MTRKLTVDFPRTTVVACFYLMLLGCSVNPFIRQHEDLARHCAAIRQVAVVPPQIEIYTVSAGGAKTRIQEQVNRMTEDLVTLINRELVKNGFQAFPVKLDEVGKMDSEILFRDAQIRQIYDRVTDSYKAGNRAGTQNTAYECNLGEEAKDLAAFAHADALIFARLSGYRRTGGSIAGEMTRNLVIAIGTAGLVILPQEATGVRSLQLTLVDGKTGEAIWASQAGATKFGFTGPAFDQGELENLVEKLFKYFPKR